MKNLFRRLTVSLLTLAMLLPCLMGTPSSAAESGPVEMYRWTPVNREIDSAAISCNLFNTTGMLSYTHSSGDHYMYTEDGPVTMHYGAFYNQTSAAKTWGLPYENVVYNGSTKARTTENLKFVLEELPILFTHDKEVINLNIGYAFIPSTHTTNAAYSRMMRVYVSVDGENYLEDYAGVRWTRLLGMGNSAADGSGNDVFFYEIQTENLLDIEGLKKGDRIRKIMVWPDGEYADTYSRAYFNGITVNGYKTREEFDATVPTYEDLQMQMDPELLRQIVVTEGQNTANLEWKTDNTIYTVNAGSGATGRGQRYYPGYNYRGGVYERVTDCNREALQYAFRDGWHTTGYTNETAWGMDCANFVFNAVSRVSRGYIWACQGTMQESSRTVIPESLKRAERPYWTEVDVLNHNTPQEVYRAYAESRPGDIFVTYTFAGGGVHTRVLVDQDVVYNEDGTINPSKSVAYFTEQAGTVRYEVQTPDGEIHRVTAFDDGDLQLFLDQHPGSVVLYGHSACADLAWTYTEIYNGGYVPVTLQVYRDGLMEQTHTEIVVTGKNGPDFRTDGLAVGMSTNYVLRYTDVRLEDLNQGKELFYERRFPDTPRMSAHSYQSEELNALLAGLANGNYRLTIDVAAGPVTTVGGDVPITTKVIDFTVESRENANQASIQIPASAAKGDRVTVTVHMAEAFDTADVEVKFDTGLLTYQNGSVTPNAALKGVTQDKGILRVACVGAGASGGQLASLDFTAQSDIADLTGAIQLKSAMASTAQQANTADLGRALESADTCPSVSMADVSQGAWYHQAVDYALENGIMSGYNSSTFGPNDTLSRAMVVQVLYNKEGQPAVEGGHKFPDVESGDWFNNAVTWGSQKGVMRGYGDGRFGPNDAVTLEQIAVILWNYAGNPAFSASADSVGAHSDWAAKGLAWCVENGVLNGVPYDAVTGSATRAQTAQMLMNYLSK